MVKLTKKINNIPSASTLINSMRSIGYDFESAIADIIDNSITADAQNIDIIFPTNTNEDIYVNIIDDGIGMDRDELIEAMRFGSVKETKRSAKDLGRFGLGLKTASISQCRKLVVISKKNNEINGFSWDLDIINIKNSWEMNELSSEELGERINRVKPYIYEKESFTIVIWEKLDNIDRDVTIIDNVFDVFMREIQQMERHISLVFHRFVEMGLKIKINGTVIYQVDPFLSKHHLTTLKPEQQINTKTKDGRDEKVKMQVYILPYFKDIDPNDIEKMGGKDKVEDQGFYIYRNKRLMLHGTWFRIKPKAELSKNARIRIDIPNTLDDLWSIDIKKQKARIPSALLSQLRTEVSQVVVNAGKALKFKGNLQIKKGSIWVKRFNDKTNSVFYEINRNSEMMKKLVGKFSEKSIRDLDKVFQIIELSLPYTDIYNTVADKQNINAIDQVMEDELLIYSYGLYQDIKNTKNASKKEIVDMICSYEPFLSANIKERLLDKINE